MTPSDVREPSAATCGDRQSNLLGDVVQVMVSLSRGCSFVTLICPSTFHAYGRLFNGDFDGA